MLVSLIMAVASNGGRGVKVFSPPYPRNIEVNIEILQDINKRLIAKKF